MLLNAVYNTAPKLAPDEIPKTYGSARGFCTTNCKTFPETANMLPTRKLPTTLGSLMFKIKLL